MGSSSKKSGGSGGVVAESEVNKEVSINVDDSCEDISTEIDAEADMIEDVSKKRKAVEDDDIDERRKRFGSGDSAFSETPFDLSDELDNNRSKRT